jgi:hypothetical protein
MLPKPDSGQSHRKRKPKEEIKQARNQEQSGMKIEHRWRENHGKHHCTLKPDMRRKITNSRNENEEQLRSSASHRRNINSTSKI